MDTVRVSDLTVVADARPNYTAWFVGAIFAGYGTLVTAMLYDQRDQLRALQVQAMHQAEIIGQIQGYDSISQADRLQLRSELTIVEQRQQRVIGTLATLSPKSAAEILGIDLRR